MCKVKEQIWEKIKNKTPRMFERESVEKKKNLLEKKKVTNKCLLQS